MFHLLRSRTAQDRRALNRKHLDGIMVEQADNTRVRIGVTTFPTLL